MPTSNVVKAVRLSHTAVGFHQTSDRDSHKKDCNKIKKKHAALATEEQRLRDFPGDFMTPANVFEEREGHFWGILETRTYMRLRYALIEALLKVNTRDAVQAALDHAMDMLRLCRSDNIGVRDRVPALYLRLGMDQEAYDFCKWYATDGSRGDYDWGDMNLGFLDVKDANIFESSMLEFLGCQDANILIVIALIKIRLLHQLIDLRSSNAIRDQVPQEVLDKVRRALVTKVVLKEKDIMDEMDPTAMILNLRLDIETLFFSIQESCPYFWPALLDPEQHLSARPAYYSSGSLEQTQLYVQYNYHAWAETPRALDVIKCFVDGAEDLSDYTRAEEEKGGDNDDDSDAWEDCDEEDIWLKLPPPKCTFYPPIIHYRKPAWNV
ncbi:hypothetical protein LTR84_001880 [Exophiala bonariae]|uniref:Uncharacterized protein n=1 Tax=Exophiala bonariae TaxID=1690606 RepID=A0AAV9NCZ4_9EURO|nr:hypothetical protein LTR84_001880 [Exophiala bonariae]